MVFAGIPTWTQWKTASSSFMRIRALKPKLVRIDFLVKKYHEVSDMSRINVLMELKNAIVDWSADKLDRDVGTGRLEAMRALEEVVLRKLYALDGWGKHRYLTAVCIGYEISTGDYNPNLQPVSDQERRRHEIVDVGASCNALRAAIDTAYTNYQTQSALLGTPVDQESKILKIFMAPEFYFRGRYGAFADIGLNAKILTMMRTETGKGRYADWLFVLGSALFSTDMMMNDLKTGNLLENYALVQRGGPKTSEHHDVVIAKEFPSHVDFKHPGVSNLEWYDPTTSRANIAGITTPHIGPQGGRRDPIRHALDATVKSVSELIGGTIFTMDSIMFGLEVCRDHYLARLAHSKEAGKVQIQLIPSAGMSIEDTSIACVADGIVFNVDGVTPHVEVKVHSGILPDPTVVRSAVSGGGTVRIYEEARIPWPGLVRADVATHLKLRQKVLSGTIPIPPPRRRF